MSLEITKKQKEKIIRLLKAGEDLPNGYKNLLFPNQKKEYELVYAGKERKEDIIAETLAVPFQKIKTFGENGDKWTNKLIFGDNLQILKEIYNDQKDKNLLGTKDKIKLIYIDPPFATKQDFMKNGEKVYQDKVIGAEFLEFLRERLILAKEILADDGNIFVHLDYKKGNHVKILLDEIFGENNFLNEIVWHYQTYQGQVKAYFPRKHDSIFYYAKSNKHFFRLLKDTNVEKTIDFTRWNEYLNENNEITGANYPKKDSRFKGYYSRFIKENHRKPGPDDMILRLEGNTIDSVWNIKAVDPKDLIERLDYPTQKPEALLERIIKASSNAGDIVMDFFAGSGTTLAVAEKLNRRWIGCDCGKLAIYTIQKRILTIADSKSLEDKKEKYGREPKPFTLYNAGLYDYQKMKELPWEEYRRFALNLFEVRDEKHKLSGIELDGWRGNDHIMVFNHEKHKDVVLDYGYIDDLHKNIGAKISNRFFIIIPAGNVSFMEDYIERGNIRYYILRIPYSIINKLHKKDFSNLKQPMDEKDVNNTVEAVGFDFIQTPEVECDYSADKENLIVKIKNFKSRTRSKKPLKLKNRESLSMVMVDWNFDGQVFDLDKTFFAEEIRKNDFKIKIEKKKADRKIMFIYMDIFGNEKREIKGLKDFK